MVADRVRVPSALLPLGCSPFSSRAWSLGVFQQCFLLAIDSLEGWIRLPLIRLGRPSGPFDWCELAVRRLPNRRCFRKSALLHALHSHRPRLGLQPSNSSFEAPHPTNIQAATSARFANSLTPRLLGQIRSDLSSGWSVIKNLSMAMQLLPVARWMAQWADFLWCRGDRVGLMA